MGNKSIFISHNHQDKPFVNKLAKELSSYGITSWVDESEIHYGESLVKKISETIEQIDCVIAVISSNSVNSNWVRQELDWAMTKEIKNQRVVVIPIIIEKIDIPFFLSSKYYADFTNDKEYQNLIKKLAMSIKHHKGESNDVPNDETSFGQSVNINYKTTLLPIYIVASLIVLSISAIILTSLFYNNNSNITNADFIKNNINTFWIIVIALMMAELLRLLILRYQISIDPVFSYDNGLIRITSLFFKNYRKIMIKHRKKLLIKVAIFFELMIIVGIMFALSYAYKIFKIAIE